MLESAQIDNKKQVRRNDEVVFKDSLTRKKPWIFCVYKELKMPTIYTGKNYDDVYSMVKDNSKLIIKELEKDHNLFTGDEFLMDEFLKLIIYYIKIEICYTRKRNSELLEYIISHEYMLDKIREKLSREVDEINASSFGNIEYLEHLNRCLEIYKDILNPNVILAIIMNNNMPLILNGNIYILNKEKENIIQNHNIVDEKKLEINDFFETLEKINKSKRVKNIKKRLTASALVLLLGGSGFLDLNLVHLAFLKKPIYNYKTTHHIYTSLGSEEVKSGYEKENSRKLYTTISVYGEVYYKDGLLYRDVETYNVKDFETTSELENYYNIDFELIENIVHETKTIEVNEGDVKEEYKIIDRVTQDKEDKTLVNEVRHTGNMLVFLILSILVILIDVITVMFGVEELMDLKKKIKVFYDEGNHTSEEITTALDYVLNKLKENGLTLNDIFRIIDEITEKQELYNLTIEQKKLIEEYKSLLEKNVHLIDKFSKMSNNKLLKKYKER